ncbi:MAG: type II secretion system protein F, partial [Actinobacteria bacterium]|nr:type II secretion system protein F [Actinomycetota bacterium]
MSGVLLGLTFGLGLACIWWSFWPRAQRPVGRVRRSLLTRLADEIVLAGIRGLRPGVLLAGSLIIALVVLLAGL